MNGMTKLLGAGLAVAVALPCGLTMLVVSSATPAAGGGLCAPLLASGAAGPGPGGWAGEGSWNSEQVANAAIITNVGATMGVPRYGWVVAVATAMQESSLRNLGHLGEANDHDSLGLFQQRPSQGWGTPEQVMNPVYAAGQFYQRLLKVDRWQSLSLTQAAQAVQRSGAADAYAKWQGEAEHLVSLIAARLGLSQDCGGGGAGAWVLPLKAGTYTLTSPFGPRWGTFHYGQDFGAATGTPIYAAAAGKVVQADCTSPFCDQPGDVDADGSPVTPGCGWTIKIDHGGGTATMYCHASGLSIRAGQQVGAGQLIGWVGSTGNSTGAHLHFQLHRGAPPIDSSTAVDPVAFLRGVGLNP